MICANRFARIALRIACATETTGPVLQERRRHININEFSRWLPKGGGFSRPGGQGSPDRWPGVKSLCAVCGIQGIFNIFVWVPGREDIGYPAGRIGDRGDREIVYVPNIYVPFPASSSENFRSVVMALVVEVCLT